MQGLDMDHRGDVLLVAYQGQMTFENTGEIRQHVEAELGTEGWKALVFDLSGVGFIDSSGIGTLVALNSTTYSAGRKMYLMSPTVQVMKTLELVKLAEFFDFVSGPEELDLVIL